MSSVTAIVPALVIVALVIAVLSDSCSLSWFRNRRRNAQRRAALSRRRGHEATAHVEPRRREREHAVASSSSAIGGENQRPRSARKPAYREQSTTRPARKTSAQKPRNRLPLTDMKTQITRHPERIDEPARSEERHCSSEAKQSRIQADSPNETARHRSHSAETVVPGIEEPTPAPSMTPRRYLSLLAGSGLIEKKVLIETITALAAEHEKVTINQLAEEFIGRGRGVGRGDGGFQCVADRVDAGHCGHAGGHRRGQFRVQ